MIQKYFCHHFLTNAHHMCPLIINCTDHLHFISRILYYPYEQTDRQTDIHTYRQRDKTPTVIAPMDV